MRPSVVVKNLAVALAVVTTCSFAVGRELRIENGLYALRFDTARSVLTASRVGAGRPFIRGVELSQPVGAVRARPVTDPDWGEGEAIEFLYADGSSDLVALFPDLPFLVFQASLKNTSGESRIVNRLHPAVLTLELDKPVEELRALGTGGLGEVAGAGSYSFLAVADPETRTGVVAGWLTHHRGSGLLFGGAEGTLPVLRARLDFGRLQLTPGATEKLETLVVGHFDDARLGLEAYADAVAARHRIQLPPQPAVYCTWYHSRASDEKELEATSAFAEEKLAPYGFSVIQIDDGWQAGIKDNGPKKDFTKINPEGPYPAGMKQTADRIKARGLVPGIWFMPFAGAWDDPWFADKQDLFATKDDKPFVTRWGGTCLDTTNPKTRSYIRSIADRIANEWGYRYFKLDGLWTGTATKIRYVNDEYVEDDFGESTLYDASKTHIEAYRDGLKIVREAAGKEVFLLGCNVAQNMRTLGGSFGLLDSMRIGPDNGRKWEQMIRGPFSGSSLYFLHGRVWYNDPDPLYVRDGVPLEQARALASWVALTGQLNASSTDYEELSEERLDLLRRTMPAHREKPRPVDLFEERIARVWLLNNSAKGFRNHVIGLFNWDGEKPATIRHTLERIGLEKGRRYVGFDYWANEFLGPLPEKLNETVPPASCRIIAARAEAGRPVLVSTSRHVSQGAVDVKAESWRADLRELRGVSAVTGGDDYELRIWCPEGFRARSAGAGAAEVKFKQAGNELRVVLATAGNADVEWTVSF